MEKLESTDIEGVMPAVMIRADHHGDERSPPG